MSEAELQPGEVIVGKYSIIEAIGVGGSATVYRAQRVGMAQEVALKLMHAEHPDSDNEKVRFAREAELVKKIEHPHVVPLLDYGHTEHDVPFLVFALLHGQSLERKIREHGSLPWAQTGRLSVQVLKALEKAHSLGVVHRDIKPANIFLANGILGEVAQVLDFGLAKMVKEQDTNLTQAGALLGTPRYMAPEQVRGETITHAADIYAFGLVMAEMLLGRPLVTGAKELDIYVAQGSDKPIFVPDEVLSTPFGNIIQRAVTKKVEVRYHMASQMLADVAAVLDNLEGPQEDVEADLDATRMIDPSAAPILVNAHAEKMRRVLNAAANKKAADERPKASSANAERPTRIPPKEPAPAEPIEDEATAATGPDIDVGAPPPIPEAAFDGDPGRAPLPSFPAPSSGSPAGIASQPTPSSDPAIGAQPAVGVAPMGEHSASPVSAPHSFGGGVHAMAPSSGPLTPISLGHAAPSPAAPSPAVPSPAVPSAARLAPARGQTGVAVALAVVLLLIGAGIAAIMWMLGVLVV